MTVKGIDLEINDSGEVVKIEEPDGELCAGLVICPNCEDRICKVADKSWADIDKCPINKWVTLWQGEPVAPPHQYQRDACYTCGGKKFWKSGSGPVICEICHPPMTCVGDIERTDVPDITVKKPEPSKKKGKIKRSVKVVKKPGKQSNFFS